MVAPVLFPALQTMGNLTPTGGAGGAAGPATASAGIGSITPAFDSSNWTVATSGSKASATNSSGGAGMGANWLYIGSALILGLLVWKKL